MFFYLFIGVKVIFDFFILIFEQFLFCYDYKNVIRII